MATNKLSSGIRSIYLSSDELHEYSVIAAIDFGTSSSGYAFAFLQKGCADISLADIQLNKWQMGSASSSTDKAPTTVLLKPDKSFDCFGYKAEDKYAKLCDTRRQAGWWYFERFKMKLYNTKTRLHLDAEVASAMFQTILDKRQEAAVYILSRDVVLQDAENKTMPAKDVFSIVILHLKDRILEDVKRQNPGIEDDDVLYVLTVPAIWSDAAKQFMREAATASNVGMKGCNLKLVLEPEAASAYCRKRKSRVVRESPKQTRLESLESGHKYIILDLGGGTADIATHKVIQDGNLHELDHARGDNLGGQKFNEKFLSFLSQLFGEEVLTEWRLKRHGDYLRIQRAIEGIKWEVSETEEEVFFEVPSSLVKHFNEKSGLSVEKKLSVSKFCRSIELVDESQLIMKNEFVCGFFDTILTGLKRHMADIARTTSGIQTVFIVGGLAKSAYVRHVIQAAYPGYQLIVPEDPGVAVLKGAVLLGNRPQTIAARIAKFSYGIGVAPNFVEGKHDERYKFTMDGEVLCRNVFDKLIERGQVLKYGDTFTTTTHIDAKMAETKQKVFNTSLYQSTSENPTYHTEPGCTKLGGIKEHPPAGGWPDEMDSEVKIIVGEAEFKFLVTDSLGRKYETTVDFLPQK